MMDKEELKKWREALVPIIEETKHLKTKEDWKSWVQSEDNDEKIKTIVKAYIAAMAHTVKPIFNLEQSLKPI